jgi:hypothetical protein
MSGQQNTVIVWNVLTSFVFGNLITQSQLQSSLYSYFSFDGTSMHVNLTIFKFAIFVMVGWFQSWTKLSDVSMLVGILLWFTGHVLIAIIYWAPLEPVSMIDLQCKYMNFVYVDILMINVGGAMYFWGTRTMLDTIFFLGPPIFALIIIPFTAQFSFVQMHAVVATISFAPVIMFISTWMQPFETPKPKGSTPNYAHFVFVLCSSMTLFVPYSLLHPFLVSKHATPNEIEMVMLTMVGGTFAGNAIDFLTEPRPWFFAIIQPICFLAWAIIADKGMVFPAFAVLAFFLGFSTISMSVAGLMRSTSKCIVMHMTCMMIGAFLFLTTTRLLVKEGELNYQTLFWVLFGVAALGLVMSVISMGIK